MIRYKKLFRIFYCMVAGAEGAFKEYRGAPEPIKIKLEKGQEAKREAYPRKNVVDYLNKNLEAMKDIHFLIRDELLPNFNGNIEDIKDLVFRFVDRCNTTELRKGYVLNIIKSNKGNGFSFFKPNPERNIGEIMEIIEDLISETLMGMPNAKPKTLMGMPYFQRYIIDKCPGIKKEYSEDGLINAIHETFPESIKNNNLNEGLREIGIEDIYVYNIKDVIIYIRTLKKIDKRLEEAKIKSVLQNPDFRNYIRFLISPTPLPANTPLCDLAIAFISYFQNNGQQMGTYILSQMGKYSGEEVVPGIGPLSTLPTTGDNINFLINVIRYIEQSHFQEPTKIEIVDIKKIKEELKVQLEKFAHTRIRKVSIDEHGSIHPFNGFPTMVPNVNKAIDFYGEAKGQNIPNTYLSKSLYDLLIIRNKQIETRINPNPLHSIYILTSRVQNTNKNFMAVYDENGDLKILTYVSIGKERKTDSLEGKLKQTKTGKELINTNNISAQHHGSSMWRTVNIPDAGGKAFHTSGLGVDGKPRSDGCIRMPLLPNNGLVKLLERVPQGTIVNMMFDDLYLGD